MAEHVRAQRKRRADVASAQPALMRDAAHTTAEAPQIVEEVLGDSGQPLDEQTRAFMEPRFGHDFSRVRVHTNERAAESAEVVNALAYTVGRDIVFGAGRYVPGSAEGQRLLAHELTHVAQQAVGSVDTAPASRGISIGESGDGCEQEADAMARQTDALSAIVSPSADYVGRPLFEAVESDRSPIRPNTVNTIGPHGNLGQGALATLLTPRSHPVVQREEGEHQSSEVKDRADEKRTSIPEIEGKRKVYEVEGERDFQWVEVFYGMSVELKSSAKAGKTGARISMSSGGELEVSAIEETGLGETFKHAELKFEGEPGKLTKIAFEVGGEQFGLEASANANWTKPFTFAAKHRIQPGQAKFKGIHFEGELEISYEFSVKPGPKFFANLVRATSEKVIEAAGSTEFAVIGTSVVWAAWVGGGLYLLGKADYEGNEKAIGLLFSRGFATMLAQLSEPSAGEVDTSLLTVNWRGLLDEARRAYHELGSGSLAARAAGYLELAGRAKVLQSIAHVFPTEDARKSWAEMERESFGKDRHAREMLYLGNLMEQVTAGIAAEDLFLTRIG